MKQLEMPENLGEYCKSTILNAFKEIIEEQRKQINSNPWLSLKEGAAYAGVSYNTFIKFRELGLKVAEIDGIKRVSKKEIDRFLENNSF
ncbi:helix-turn-helix domain-containing protein [Lysinibacillus sp. CD3-6]|uniref:helix-turn-helix domain-containing protein n=1 Tax=Lysinibacillus sp. CD3-6 TaxID=2892541 RepID=UPI001D17A9AF|nr:helix-turn-helix domain-containing protein [Lysinibacillus sp. CD3-6]UED79616.1 helix-turn-helix domain-containing protein [Lysinibacillus sp. CD3-6]